MPSISQILKKGQAKLNKYNIPGPELEAEILLSFSCKKDRIYLLSHPEEELDKSDESKFMNLIDKRISNQPLAYIIGKKAFYELDFLVNKNVLIPRPETEIMVDLTFSLLKKHLAKDPREKIKYIDVGTGTACIPISVAHLCQKNDFFKNISISAIDISPKALEIAKQNAKIHGMEDLIEFKQGHLLKPLLDAKTHKSSSDMIITANLPYLSKEQIKDSPSIQKEPVLALDGGKNGMDLYIELFKQIIDIKEKYQPRSITILCEIDHTQVDIFKIELANYLPQSQYEIIKDLSGYDRIVEINY